jgi:hypothetical protein
VVKITATLRWITDILIEALLRVDGKLSDWEYAAMKRKDKKNRKYYGRGGDSHRNS